MHKMETISMKQLLDQNKFNKIKILIKDENKEVFLLLKIKITKKELLLKKLIYQI